MGPEPQTRPEAAGSLAARLASLSPAVRDRLARRVGVAAGPSWPSQAATYPASFAQERLWIVDQLAVARGSYNLPIVLRLRGDFIPALLHKAIAHAMQRHEVLRTALVHNGTTLRQVVQTDVEVPFSLVNLRGLPQEVAVRQLAELEHRVALDAFDLAVAPLFRVAVAALDADEHVLAICFHHSITDAWSTSLLLSELTTTYSALMCGTDLPSQEVLQYGQFAVWQRQRLDDRGHHDGLLGYWRNALAGAPPLMRLPYDRPRPSRATYAGGEVRLQIAAPIVRRLREHAALGRTSLFSVLASAWLVVLAKYSCALDLVVGVPVAGRDRSEFEPVLGLFVNTLPLRVDLHGAEVFEQVVDRVRSATLEGIKNQELPFERLVEDLNPERSLAYNPLFQVMFTLQNTPSLVLDIPDVDVSFASSPRTTARFDLALNAEETDDGLSAVLEYSTDLFHEATVARFAWSWREVLRAVADDLTCRVADLAAVSAPERAVLKKWASSAEAGVPSEATLATLLEAQAVLTPDAPAVTDSEGSITYAAMRDYAGTVAAAIGAYGLGAEDRVAVCLTPSRALIAALHGVVRAGAAYVPLDPVNPVGRLRLMVEDSEAKVVLADAATVHVASALGLPVVDMGGLRERRGAWPVAAAPPESLRAVLYTSGSTGLPKGVAVTEAALVRHIRWMQERFPLSTDDRVLQRTSFAFDISTWELLWPFTVGAHVVVSADGGRDPDALATLVDASGISVAVLVPSQLPLLLAPGRVRKLRGIRRFLFCGEALPPSSVNALSATVPGEIVNLYGPAEATVAATAWRVPELGGSVEVVPIGAPIAGATVQVVGATFDVTPVGVQGEIVIGGPGLARGYLGSPGRTAERFVPDPHGGGTRLYRTGDLGRWRSDGMLLFLGRADHQVKVRGFRVELGEVEAALRKHVNVDAVVVLAAGEDEQTRIVAYVVPKEPTPTTSSLRDHLRRLLPDYMVPNTYAFLPSLPFLPNGKVDRASLPQVDTPASDSFVAPRDNYETFIAEVWQEVLGVPRIAADDDFFDVGGNSIAAVVAMDKLRSLLGNPTLSVALLFEHTTVEALAAAVRSIQEAGGGSCIVRLAAGTDGEPPLFVVHGTSGELHHYYRLGQVLGRPCLGIQGGTDYERGEGLEGLARRYADAMREASADRPFHLAGFSAGGLFALAVAARLAADGEEVGHVFIIDTAASEFQGLDLDDAAVLSALVPFAPDISTLRGANPGERVRLTLEAGIRRGDLPPSLSESDLAAFCARLVSNARALATFDPASYKGLVTLIARAGAASRLRAGWRAAGVRLNVVSLPVEDHMDLVREPAVTKVASVVADRLRRSERRGAPGSTRTSSGGL